MAVAFIDLTAQDAGLVQEVHARLDVLLRRSEWILGDEVAQFEEEFASYCGTRYAVGTNSGLSALELSLRACGVGQGAEVITAANTFVATALAITHVGAQPVLVDVDPETQSLDPSLLEDALTERTRAIVPVHLHGRPAEMEPILAFARAQGLMVIEDACQAHGARYRGERVGSIGDAAAFSFYPAKNLGAYGDGGIVVTNDPEVADTIRLLRHYGQRIKNVHEIVGFNRRLDSLQAAILRLKLRHLDEWNEARRRMAHLYDGLLCDAGVALPSADDDIRESVWHLYVVRTPCRDSLRAFLGSRGIETGIHYPVPIHLQPAYRDLGHEPGTFPATERLAAEVLSLPMHPTLTERQVSEVADAIREFTRRVEGDLAADLLTVTGESRTLASELPASA